MAPMFKTKGFNYKRIFGIALFAIGIAAGPLSAKYVIDPSFSIRLETNSATIETVAQSSDGGFYAGGAMYSVGGVVSPMLAKIKADGSVDAAFADANRFNGSVQRVRVQPDGKILVAGSFSSCSGVRRSGLARLNADGSLDTSYNPGSGFSEAFFVTDVFVVQPDGKLLFYNAGKSFNGKACGYFGRLNADATLDATFAPAVDTSDVISAAVQSDGKILLLTQPSDAVDYKLVRLNADGSLDSSFNLPSKLTPGYGQIIIQPNGRIIVPTANRDTTGYTYHNLARLMADGSLDSSFQTSELGVSVDYMVLLPDGSLVFYGCFQYSLNSWSPTTLMRLNADGSLDSTFNPGTGFNKAPSGLACENDGKILALGSFTSYNGQATPGLARININGSLDSLAATPITGAGSVGGVIPVSATKFFVVGTFDLVNGVARSNIARINIDGSLDTSFQLASSVNTSFKCVTMQSDGRLLFDTITRVNTDGTVDATYQESSRIWATTYYAAFAKDGSIYGAGYFYILNENSGNSVNHITHMIHLASDGTFDPTFDAFWTSKFGNSQNIYGYGRLVFVANNQDLLLSIISTSGTGTPQFYRIDHSLSGMSLMPTDNFSYARVDGVIEESDGKLLLMGAFNTANQTGVPYIRVNADLSIDSSFAMDTSVLSQLSGDGLVMSDGRILFANSSTGLTRFTKDGAVDASFHTGLSYLIGAPACVTQDNRIFVASGYGSSNASNVPMALLVDDGQGSSSSSSSSSSGSSSSGGFSSSGSGAGGGGGGAASDWYLAALGVVCVVRWLRGPMRQGAPRA